MKQAFHYFEREGVWCVCAGRQLHRVLTGAEQGSIIGPCTYSSHLQTPQQKRAFFICAEFPANNRITDGGVLFIRFSFRILVPFSCCQLLLSTFWTKKKGHNYAYSGLNRCLPEQTRKHVKSHIVHQTTDFQKIALNSAKRRITIPSLLTDTIFITAGGEGSQLVSIIDASQRGEQLHERDVDDDNNKRSRPLQFQTRTPSRRRLSQAIFNDNI